MLHLLGIRLLILVRGVVCAIGLQTDKGDVKGQVELPASTGCRRCRHWGHCQP